MPVSAAFKAHAFALRSDDVNINLVEIDHPNLPEPARISTDTVDTVHLGNTYVSCPVKIQWAVREGGRAPTSRLEVDNVGKIILDPVRSVVSPMPTVRFISVLASQLNTIDFEQTMDLADAKITPEVISGELTVYNLLNRPVLTRVSARICPGLF